MLHKIDVMGDMYLIHPRFTPVRYQQDYELTGESDLEWKANFLDGCIEIRLIC